MIPVVKTQSPAGGYVSDLMRYCLLLGWNKNVANCVGREKPGGLFVLVTRTEKMLKEKIW